MENSSSPQSPSNDEREFVVEKLTKIDGIAGKTAQVMYEIGIRGYADLASYLRRHTAEEISDTLKEHGLNRPPGFIKKDSWIRQAELLAQAEKDAQPAPATEPKQDAVEAAGVQSLDHDAVFTVLFDVVKGENGEAMLQTTVYDEKNGGKEMVFREGDLTQWVNWMLHQADLPPAVQPVQPAGKLFGQAEVEGESPPISSPGQATGESADTMAPELPSGPVNAQVDIRQIQIFETASRPDTNERMIKAEVVFKITGADAEALAYHGQSYRIEIYTIESTRGTPAFVAANEGWLRPQTFEYKQQLEFAMPMVGRYELHSLVRLPASGEMKGYYQGPTLRITP